MLKRTNHNPDDCELLELMSRDSLKRNQDITDMLHLLMSIDKGLSIFLDGDWGSGKTYFVRSLKMVIDSLNNGQDTVHETINNIATSAIPNEKSWQCDYLPVYYNAWNYDYWGDPLASIACTLAIEAGEPHLEIEQSDSKVAKTALEALMEVALNYSVPGLGTVIGKATTALEREDLLEAFKKRSSLRKAVAEAVNLVLKERANKLLLIIDELDRCEPRFACRLLEELKALFELDNVVVLYSLNTTQLARVIEGQYGAGFNGARYLSKFYDISVPIRTVNMDDYLILSEMDPNYQSSLVIKSVIEAHDMSLREANRLIDICKQSLEKLNDAYNTNEMVFRVSFMDIVEAGIRVSNPSAYDRLTNKGDYAVFSEEVMGSKAIRECFLTMFRNCIKHGAHQIAIDDEDYIAKLIEGIATLRWSNQFERKNAAQLIIREAASFELVNIIER